MRGNWTFLSTDKLESFPFLPGRLCQSLPCQLYTTPRLIPGSVMSPFTGRTQVDTAAPQLTCLVNAQSLHVQHREACHPWG